jgi:hypothetical protein
MFVPKKKKNVTGFTFDGDYGSEYEDDLENEFASEYPDEFGD